MPKPTPASRRFSELLERICHRSALLDGFRSRNVNESSEEFNKKWLSNCWAEPSVETFIRTQLRLSSKKISIGSTSVSFTEQAQKVCWNTTVRSCEAPSWMLGHQVGPSGCCTREGQTYPTLSYSGGMFSVALRLLPPPPRQRWQNIAQSFLVVKTLVRY